MLSPLEQDVAQEQPPPFAPPPDTISHLLTEVEQLAGPLPLALRAWYETIGCVNFVGSTPPHWNAIGCGGMDVWYQIVQSGFSEDLLEAFERVYPSLDTTPEWCGLDPLYISPLERALDAYHRHCMGTNDQRQRTTSVFSITLSPDYHGKYHISGGGMTYNITLPNPTFDLEIAEWHHTTFVHYLRICCRWGGFPGLARCAILPQQDLEFLTRDLLPF